MVLGVNHVRLSTEEELVVGVATIKTKFVLEVAEASRVCRRAAESASPQGRVLAHTCGESKYFAGSGGAGAQLQLIYGFADYFAAAPCVRLPSSLTRTRAHTLAHTNKSARGSIVCALRERDCASRVETHFGRKKQLALTRLSRIAFAHNLARDAFCPGAANAADQHSQIPSPRRSPGTDKEHGMLILAIGLVACLGI